MAAAAGDDRLQVLTLYSARVSCSGENGIGGIGDHHQDVCLGNCLFPTAHLVRSVAVDGQRAHS